MFFLLLALAFPLPCRAADTCWLEWDPAERVEWYEVLAGDVVCDTLRGFIGRKGRFHPPRTRWWPRPTPACPQATAYRVRACNAFGCGGVSDPVEWEPQPMACLRAGCEEPCFPGAPRRAAWLPECPQ